MKTTHLKTVIALFGIVMLLTTGSTLSAQNEDYSTIMKELTAQQQEMLQAQRQLMLENREQLRASLTDAQLAVLQDQTQTKDQRLLLIETFTDAQKQLVQSQKEQLLQLREQFRQSLTQAQRQMLQERMNQTRESSGQGEMRNVNGFGADTGIGGERTRGNGGNARGNGVR